jgi:hypothetical protein
MPLTFILVDCLNVSEKHYFQFYCLILKMEALNLPETLKQVYSRLAWPVTLYKSDFIYLKTSKLLRRYVTVAVHGDTASSKAQSPS